MSAAMDEEVLVDYMEQDVSVWSDIEPDDVENNTAGQVPVVTAVHGTRPTNYHASSYPSRTVHCPPTANYQ